MGFVANIISNQFTYNNKFNYFYFKHMKLIIRKLILTICGMATIIKAFFLPIKSDIRPKIIFPKNPPTAIIAPIHDAWSTVIFPLSNGDSSDCNTKKLAEGHAKAAPYAMVIKLPIKSWIKNIYIRTKCY